MRKLLSSLVALAILAPVAVKAQTVASGTVAVTASVAEYGTVTGVRPIAFGSLTRGAAATVSATDKAKNGMAQITYNYAAIVSAAVTTALTGPTTLPMTLACATSSDDNTYAAVADCAAIGTMTAPAAIGLVTKYIGLGGTIAQATVDGAPAGTYNGVVTVTIAK